MSRIFLLSLAFVGQLILLTPCRGSGQTIPSHYEFFEYRQEADVFAGVTGQGTGRFGFGPGPGPVFGARYGIHLGGPFGLEGTVSYSPTTRDVVDPTREEGNMVAGEADATLMSIDVRLRFSLTGDRAWRGLNPSILMGAGVIWDLDGLGEADAQVLPDDQFEFGTRFVAPLGGSIRWFVTDRFLIRGDIGVTMFQLKTPRGYLDPDRDFSGIGEKQWVSGPSFILSLGYLF